MPDQPTRDQVPAEETWNLADLYASAEEWEADLAQVEAELPALTAYQGRLSEGAGTLLAFLRSRDAAAERYDRVAAYANLSLAVDGTSALNQSLQARAAALGARAGAALSFVANELLALPEGTLERYVTTEPALETYRKQLEDLLLRRGHLLAPQAEQALAALGEVLNLPRTLWDRTTATDLACAPVESEAGTLPVSIARWQFGYQQAADRDLRRRAYVSLTEGLARHQHALAAGLAAQIKRNVVLARLRGYGSAAEMILAPQRVPVEVYRSILQVVHDGMAPHVRRLARLRQRVLGLDRMYHYDLHAPLDPGYNPAVTFDEARRLIREGLSTLGDEYLPLVEAAFRDRWVDRADNAGKRSGAFCASVYGVHPYVFTTWRDELRAALILAHELGHAGQGVFSGRHQVISNTGGGSTYTGAGHALFFVEAPSTANELLVGWHILETAGDVRVRRYVIQQFLGTFIHNMVTHMLEAHFEQALYDLAEDDRPLTTAAILETQAMVFERFYGDAIAHSGADRLYWAQQPHFYYGLYPYTYSAGLACGYSLARAIQEEGAPAVARWLDTLRAGASLPPIRLAAQAGVDMTSAEPLERTVAYFGSLVDELEATSA